MSKMSTINLELQDYANDLGYSTVQDALDDGYNAVQDLVTGEWSLQRVNMAQEQDQAHAAWLKEKEGVLNELYNLSTTLEMTTHLSTEPVKKAIKFIEGAKHE